MSSGIVLLTMARSRSSMVAEIFRRHGVFFGRTQKMEDGLIGYNENLTVKLMARKWRPSLFPELLAGGNKACPNPPDTFAEDWLNLLQKEGHEGGPWGAKVDAFCYKLYDGLDYTRIGIFRNPLDIRKSCMKVLRGILSDPVQWDKVIKLHHELLYSLAIPMIDTDQLMIGNHTSLERAMKKCGLEYDREIGDSVIGAR